MEEKKTYGALEKRIQELEGQPKGSVDRGYKSRLFSYLFGREENKRWTLSLYNAIHGTSYDDPSCITLNTIEDVVPIEKGEMMDGWGWETSSTG